MKNAKWEEIWADALTLCFMQDVKIHAVAVSNVLDAAMLIIIVIMYFQVKKYCVLDTCLPNPCKNNGTCVTHPSGNIECHCHGNYVGLRCDYQGS